MITKDELSALADEYAPMVAIRHDAGTAAYLAYIAGFEKCQQLLQQTDCSTLREELEQMLNSEQKATDEESDSDTQSEMSKYVDAIKMVLLLIDARQPVA